MTAKWNGRQRHPLKNEPAFSLLQLACELANLKKDPERRLATRERQTWARKLLTALDHLNVGASPSPLHVFVPSQTKRLAWGVVPVLDFGCGTAIGRGYAGSGRGPFGDRQARQADGGGND